MLFSIVGQAQLTRGALVSNIFPGLQVVSSLLAVLLFLAAGLSIAALVATSWHRFWFYVNEGGIRLRYGNFNTAAAPPYASRCRAV